MSVIDQIYFPFADGALTFDCQACGSKCCSLGGGFGLPRQALDELGQRYPALKYFGRATGAQDYISVSGIGPRCFLLKQDGACAIHRADGLKAKPFTCRAYPANQFHWLGDVMVVDLHKDCPFDLAASAAEEGPLSHRTLRRFILDQQRVVVGRASEEHRHYPRAEVDRIFAIERQCRDHLPERIDEPPLRFAASWDPSPAAAELEEFEASLLAFLQLGPGQTADSVEDDRRLLVNFPRIRLQCILQLSPIPYDVLQLAFPRLLVAHRIFIQLAQSLSQRPLSLSTIHGLGSDNLPMLWLLAHLDCVPRLLVADDDDFNLRLPRSQQVAVSQLVSFIASEGQRQRLTLREVLQRKGPQTISDRLMLLRSIPLPLLRRLRL